MKDVKAIIAENLTNLRKSYGLTQAQLAEKFNYSDKAICRWERGDTLPDINTLYALAEFYGVTMNDLVDPALEAVGAENNKKKVFKYRMLITALTLAAIWLFTVVFFVTSFAFDTNYWVVFIWAIPASCLAILRLWRKYEMHAVLKIIIYSIINWTVITALYLHMFSMNGVNSWMIFLIGIPLQLVIIFWVKIKEYRSNI